MMALVGACGSVGGKTGDAGGTGGGAGTGGAGGGTGGGGTGGAGGSVDASTQDSGNGGSSACSLSQPFGTPVLVAGLNGQTGSDEGARLTPDELVVYFDSDRSGNRDVYTASRSSRTDAFGAAQAVGGVDTASSEAWSSPTADNLTLYFETDRNGLYQVFVASRSTLAAQFSGAAAVANINIGVAQGQLSVLPDQSALYFMITLSGGSADLYVARRGTSGQFGTPTQVSTVNTPSNEYLPAPTPDELILYFGSDRPDSPAKGSFDIWVTSRASSSASFDPPTNVQELNTSGTEYPSWISPDNCRLYFTRTGTDGTNKIYIATRGT
jgi:Tol biopolymer transport system component